MPHPRKRHIETIFSETLKFSPIVGLFGHRQVGKTTLVSSFAKEYRTLDVSTESALIRSNPENYLINRQLPFAIDEAQNEPVLFPALKDAVRKDKAPGQFIITGSVRFSSRKKIRESLTGRIIAWELIPMDLAEIHHLPLGTSLLKISSAQGLNIPLKPRLKTAKTTVDHYLKYGGLPGLFSVRNETFRRQKIELQIQTLLERDLRLIVETKLNYDTLRRLLAELAHRQLEPFEIYPLARAVQISVPTLTNLLRALEAMYILRWIPSWGDTKKKSFIFEDQAEAQYLQSHPQSEFSQFCCFLFANLRSQWHYQNKLPVKIGQFRLRTGPIIPWIIQFGELAPLAILPNLEKTPGQTEMSLASLFLKKHPQAKVLIVHHHDAIDDMIHPQIRFLPWGKLI